MALSIWPTGGAATRRRLLRIHTVGMMLGAWSVALVLTLIGSTLHLAPAPIGVAASVVGAAVAAAWSVRAVTGRGLPVPQSAWQVPDHWRERFPPEFTFAAFGYLLGFGFLVKVVVPAFWALVALTVAIASLPVVLVAWTAYAWIRIEMTRRTLASLEASGGDPACALPTQHGLRRARLASAAMTFALASTLMLSLIGP